MPPTTSPEDKLTLRRRLRALRANIDARQRHEAGLEIARIAKRHHLLAHGRRIGFYLPAKGEIDLLPLLNRALWMGVAAHLPVVPTRGQRKLWFARLGNHPHWQVNRYGIAEYADPGKRKVRISALDLVFVPLMGFDRRGFRLGMGGGYYDASLAYLSRRRVWRKPYLIGVAYSLQEVEHIPADPWDIPLDAILTERGLLITR